MSDSDDAGKNTRKRGSERQLTKDDDPDDFVSNETEGHWKQAPTEEISKRRILKGKRSGSGVAEAPKPAEEKKAEAPAAEEKKEPAAEAKEAEDKKAPEGEKKPEEKKDEPAKPLFNFGAGAATFGSVAAAGAAPAPFAFNFNFGAPAAGAAPSFAFGLPSGGGFAPVAPAEEEGEENPEAEVAIDGPAVMKKEVLSKEQLKSGEEDDDVVVDVSPSKLFKLGLPEGTKPEEKKAKQWLEKGRGSFRVLVNKQTGKARLLMRSEAVLKVLLNVAVWKGMTCEESAGGKAVLFTAAELENDKPVVNSYTLRVGQKETAKDIITKIKDLASKADGKKEEK